MLVPGFGAQVCVRLKILMGVRPRLLDIRSICLQMFEEDHLLIMILMFNHRHSGAFPRLHVRVGRLSRFGLTQSGQLSGSLGISSRNFSERKKGSQAANASPDRLPDLFLDSPSFFALLTTFREASANYLAI